MFLEFRHGAAKLGDAGDGEVVHGNEVSANYFTALRTHAAAGRLFTAEEYRTTGGNAVVLGYGFWERRYNGDPTVIGRKLALSGRDYTIVGVAERR